MAELGPFEGDVTLVIRGRPTGAMPTGRPSAFADRRHVAYARTSPSETPVVQAKHLTDLIEVIRLLPAGLPALDVPENPALVLRPVDGLGQGPVHVDGHEPGQGDGQDRSAASP